MGRDSLSHGLKDLVSHIRIFVMCSGGVKEQIFLSCMPKTLHLLNISSLIYLICLQLDAKIRINLHPFIRQKREREREKIESGNRCKTQEKV